MNFIQSIKTVLKKYATFAGRASRSEFWYWSLFCFLASFLLSFLDVLVFHVNVNDPNAFYPTSTLFGLLVFLPSLAVTVRRLHDVDRKGWWLLISVTVVGLFFPLLYWYCKQGSEGSNRFGSNTLGGF